MIVTRFETISYVWTHLLLRCKGRHSSCLFSMFLFSSIFCFFFRKLNFFFPTKIFFFLRNKFYRIESKRQKIHEIFVNKKNESSDYDQILINNRMIKQQFTGFELVDMIFAPVKMSWRFIFFFFTFTQYFVSFFNFPLFKKVAPIGIEYKIPTDFKQIIFV